MLRNSGKCQFVIKQESSRHSLKRSRGRCYFTPEKIESLLGDVFDALRQDGFAGCFSSPLVLYPSYTSAYKQEKRKHRKVEKKKGTREEKVRRETTILRQKPPTCLPSFSPSSFFAVVIRFPYCSFLTRMLQDQIEMRINNISLSTEKIPCIISQSFECTYGYIYSMPKP